MPRPCRLSSFQTVIFDFDGTLVDSMPFWDNLVLDTCRAWQVPIDEHLLDLLPTLTIEECADYLCAHDLPQMRPDQLLDEWNQKILKAYEETLELKPGAMALVRQLAEQGVQMAIATMSRRRMVEPASVRLGLAPYIPTIVTVEDVQVGKHEPAIWHETLRQLGATLERTAVVEDAFFAANTAKQAGFHVVGVEDPANEPHAVAMRQLVDCYVRDLGELLDDSRC